VPAWPAWKIYIFCEKQNSCPGPNTFYKTVNQGGLIVKIIPVWNSKNVIGNSNHARGRGGAVEGGGGGWYSLASAPFSPLELE
jgi:hypothetical protein